MQPILKPTDEFLKDRHVIQVQHSNRGPEEDLYVPFVVFQVVLKSGKWFQVLPKSKVVSAP
jgi:hypothetical protein